MAPISISQVSSATCCSGSFVKTGNPVFDISLYIRLALGLNVFCGHPRGLGCSLQGVLLHRDLLCHRPTSRASGSKKAGTSLRGPCTCNLLMLLECVSLPGKRGIQGPAP